MTGHHITPQVFSPDILGPDARLTSSSIYPGELVKQHSYQIFSVQLGCHFPLKQVIGSFDLMDSGSHINAGSLAKFLQNFRKVGQCNRTGRCHDLQVCLRLSRIRTSRSMPTSTLPGFLYPVRLHVFSEVYRDPRTLDSWIPGAPGIYGWRTVYVYIFQFCLLSEQSSFGHRQQALTLISCGLLSCSYFQCFRCFHFDSQTPGVPGQLGRNDDLDVIIRPIDHCTLLIVNEGCHRFRIPLPSASSVPLNTPLDLEILRGYPFSNVDLVGQSVAGVIYPVDVQNLVIQSIVAIVIGIDVMEIPSMHGHWYRVVRDHGTRAQ